MQIGNEVLSVTCRLPLALLPHKALQDGGGSNSFLFIVSFHNFYRIVLTNTKRILGNFSKYSHRLEYDTGIQDVQDYENIAVNWEISLKESLVLEHI
ncbi:MAG: hypothetical protein ACJ71M_09630 [Nitrososphaeraceae archaeon]